MVFKDPLYHPYIEPLCKLFFLASALHQVVVCLRSDVPNAVGQVQDVGLIFLSAMASSVAALCTAAGRDAASALGTSLLTMAASTLLVGLGLVAVGGCGAVLWVLWFECRWCVCGCCACTPSLGSTPANGSALPLLPPKSTHAAPAPSCPSLRPAAKLRLAVVVQYLPLPAVGGYLSYVGYFCFASGLGLGCGIQLDSIASWAQLWDKQVRRLCAAAAAAVCWHVLCVVPCAVAALVRQASTSVCVPAASDAAGLNAREASTACLTSCPVMPHSRALHRPRCACCPRWAPAPC